MYLAQDARLGRRVAVKQYLPRGFAAPGVIGMTYALRGSAPGEDRLEGGAVDYMLGLTHFLREAEMLERLDHPHVARVYRVFRAQNTAYSVMEYVEGRSLADELRSGGVLEEVRLRKILGPLTDGVMVVHAAGLLHWDVQPANVMLRPRHAEPVLVGFAAVKQAMGWREFGDPEREPRRLASVPLPQEQYDERLRRGPWTDIYGIGALAHYSLSRRTSSYPDLTRTDSGDLTWTQPISDVSVHPVSMELAAAIDAALAMHPEARPQSVGEWRAMLDL